MPEKKKEKTENLRPSSCFVFFLHDFKIDARKKMAIKKIELSIFFARVKISTFATEHFRTSGKNLPKFERLGKKKPPIRMNLT